MVIGALKDKKVKWAADSSWLGQLGKVVPEGPSEEVTFVFVLAMPHGMQDLSFGDGDWIPASCIGNVEC